MRPAIVVPAFSRPGALQRLLASLAGAHYPAPVPLIIAIDRPASSASQQQQRANADVHRLAEQFHWPHGSKEVIAHKRQQGLIGNFLFCGGLSRQYGSIILLEDDLYVSQAFYHYAAQALAYYQQDARIAGIALNTLWFNGYTRQPFIPYLDDADVFFLPIPWYQGQAYTASQWTAFASWYGAGNKQIHPTDPLHPLFRHFPQTDWFPLKTKYLVTTGRTYVFPRESFTTNYGDAGTHFQRPTGFFQVPLQHFREKFHFQSLDTAIAVYDAFFEMLPDRLNRLTGHFSNCDYAVDLYATKAPAHFQAEFVLTTRPSRLPLRTFGKVMRPLEANVIASVPGPEIAFCRKEDVDTSKLASAAAIRHNDYYFAHQYRPGRRQRLRYQIAAWLYGRRLVPGTRKNHRDF
jgi:hypothetical protein